jgi:uncharacterized protein (TIGR02466 family)
MFDLGREFTETEKNFILELPQRPNMGNFVSENHEVLKQEEMAGLKEFIEASVHEYLTTVYAPKYEVRLRLTQSWCNYTNPGQFHHKHAHPNSFVSGVFYIQTRNDTDRIYFYPDKYQTIKLPAGQWNVYNSESWWFEAIQGRLILFPSSLTHMVEAVKGEHTRISMSFNTFPVGHVGDDSQLMGLHL